MKIQGINSKKQGFTLIELVVVIVIIGILAATAVPRFGNLTTQANDAVAEGVLGAIQSSAVIQLGLNSGSAPTFASVGANVDTDVTVTVTLTGGDASGTGVALSGGGATCNTSGDTTIAVVANTGNASGTIPQALCSN